MGLKGSTSQIAGIQRALNATITTIASDVAKRTAPVFTAATRQAFESGTDVYGKARPAGVDGGSLSLVQSGATRAALGFGSSGTLVKCVLPTAWAKFLIGKYRILPNGRALPLAWRKRMAQVVADTKVLR